MEASGIPESGTERWRTFVIMEVTGKEWNNPKEETGISNHRLPITEMQFVGYETKERQKRYDPFSEKTVRSHCGRRNR